MFEYFDVDTEPVTFDLGAKGDFSDIVSMWQERLKGQDIPSWSDFKLPDFSGWVPTMAMSEVSECRSDIRFRLFGSAMVSLQGKDLTGSSFRETLPGPYDAIYRNHFARFLEKPQIALGFPSASSTLDKPHLMAVVHLPLADDGHTIDRILHFARLVPLYIEEADT
ncbi:MAG: PAS domain-containing protein [Alphaproteobacteria bacterium]|nr:PAS domain-containing protein [Alphaproteobacteria bacterium]